MDGQTSEFNKIVRDAERNNLIRYDDYASRYEFETLTRFIPKISESKILDIGCGIGRFTIPLARIAKHVTGIDLSRESLRILRLHAEKLHIRNITTKAIDIRDYRNRERFDCVLLVNVIHHFQNPGILLAKIKSLLKPKGTLVIYEFNPLNPLFIPAFVMHGQVRVHLNKEYFQSLPWMLDKSLRKAGYRVDTVHKHAFLPSSLYNVSPVFVKINALLNSVPIVRELCAFHILICRYER